MLCKKWLLVCLLVTGTAIMFYITYNPTALKGLLREEKKLQIYPAVTKSRLQDTTETDTDDIQEDPGLYHVAYPRKYKFIIDQPEICEQQKPYVVFLVPVPPSDADARNGIRKTWGKEKVVRDKALLVLFIMGLHNGNDAEVIQEHLRNESLQHRDLLQSNFLDSYRNLTIKTMMMMEWLSKKCQQATYAVKVDADVLINMNNLLNMLLNMNTVPSNYMTGLVWYDSPVIRDPSNKFFLPYEVYSKNSYPPYPLGMCYIITLDLPQKFVQESKQIKPIYIEDAYLGICLEHLGISPTRPPNLDHFVVKPPQYNRCYFSQLIAVLTANTNQMTSYWTDIYSTSTPC